MKKIFLPLFAVLALTACSGDDMNPIKGETDGHAIEVRISQPTTRAWGSNITATESECTVASLDAYLFANDGTLEKVYKNLLTEAWTPTALTESQTVSLEGVKDSQEARSILFVANGSDVTSLVENAAPGSVTKEDFEALLTDELTGTPQCPLLMTAEATVEAGQASPASLRRVVDRLDLRIEQTTCFTLEKAELLNASTLSYIFPAKEGFAECRKIKLENTTPENETIQWEDPIMGDSMTDHCFKALFYFYPAEVSQMTLRLYGQQTLYGKGPAEAIYDIPLDKIVPEDMTALERNTCYTIYIHDIDISGTGTPDISVSFGFGE